MKTHVVDIVTDASGNGTGHTSVVSGYVESIRYVKSDYANNVTLAVTGETTGTPILSLAAGQMDASVTKNPRLAVHAVTDGAALVYTTDNKPVVDKIAIAGERIKLVVAAGGNAKTGTFYVTVSGPTG